MADSNNHINIDNLIGPSQNKRGSIKIASEDTESKLDEKMQEMKLQRIEEKTQQEAARLGFSYINLQGFPVATDALIVIPEQRAQELQAVCFMKTDNEFRIGATDPKKQALRQLMSELEQELQSRGALYKISEPSLRAALKLYAKAPKIKEHQGGVEINKDDLRKFQDNMQSFRDLKDMIQHVSMTDLVTLIFASAIQARASDVHIEAEEKQIKVRFRIDGFLYDVVTVKKELWDKIVNRIKLLAKLKINITDIPQDGRFTIYLSDETIDVRVSTVPSAYGESIVMRLLMSSAASISLEELGLTREQHGTLEQQIQRPNGMILNTGPTGSGKTTTLYAVLKKLNKPETKIVTLENPIEYHLSGITQSQVETTEAGTGTGTSAGAKKRHYTYAIGLKSVLRQDPDVVMVGEIRDKETVETAIQASLTGHLMLSTLHTNSAAGAIPRLLSMEARPFLLAPALNVVIGQRLVRLICEQCKEQYTPDEETMKHIRQVIDSLPVEKKQNTNIEALSFYRGKGCDACNQIGFKGRIAIFEFLVMNDEIQKLILASQISEAQIEEAAKRYGMITMIQDGVLKAIQGRTTPEEVFRVID